MTVRKILFNGITLPDPDPNMNIEDVRKLYASQYPALNNAVITHPDEAKYEFAEKGKSGGQTVEFKSSVGRKG